MNPGELTSNRRRRRGPRMRQGHTLGRVEGFRSSGSGDIIKKEERREKKDEMKGRMRGREIGPDVGRGLVGEKVACVKV